MAEFSVGRTIDLEWMKKLYEKYGFKQDKGVASLRGAVVRDHKERRLLALRKLKRI